MAVGEASDVADVGEDARRARGADPDWTDVDALLAALTNAGPAVTRKALEPRSSRDLDRPWLG